MLITLLFLSVRTLGTAQPAHLLRVSQGFKKGISQSWVLLRSLTGQVSASKLSQVVGRSHFLVVIKFMASCFFKTNTGVRDFSKMGATLLGNHINAVAQILSPLLHSIGWKQVTGPAHTQGRGEFHKGVTTRGQDQGGLCKVDLPNPVSPSLSCTQGIPQNGTPLPPIISNLTRTSSVLSLCLRELLYFRFFWPLLGDHWPLVRLRGDKSYPSTLFKGHSSSQGLLNLNGASLRPNTCFLHLFLLTILTSMLITLTVTVSPRTGWNCTGHFRELLTRARLYVWGVLQNKKEQKVKNPPCRHYLSCFPLKNKRPFYLIQRIFNIPSFLSIL